MLEVVLSRSVDVPVRLAVFDFDGTLSLVRAGWLPIMLEMMLKHLEPTFTPLEQREHLIPQLRTEILSLNGQPTILQMERLANSILTRGGTPEHPRYYFDEFARDLRQTIDHRLQKLSRGEKTMADLALPGAQQFLEALASRNVTLVLASGTYRPDVVHELGQLGLSHFFEGRVYAPDDGPVVFSKQAVMAEWLAKTNCSPQEMVAFGDGVTEIRACSQLGGYPIGIVGEELNPWVIDHEKSAQLKPAGVQLLTPNYLSQTELLKTLGLQ